MRIGDSILNRLSVMKAILRHGPVARSDLPRLTGLSAGLISQQTAQLVNQGLVRETRSSGAAMGRPRMLLEINGDGGIVLGASLSGIGSLKTAFVDFSARRLFECETRIGQAETLADLASRIAGGIVSAIEQSPFSRDQISRVGIALPAVVDSARGEVHFNTTFPVERTPFAGPISAIIGLPVTIENPLDSLARAEHWFGRASHLQDFSLIRLGISLDCAEFEDGLPKYGPNGLSSSFGHTKTGLPGDHRPCFCGAEGCLTTYASAYGILQAADLLTGLPFPPIAAIEERFAILVERAKAADGSAFEAMKLAGEQFGLGLANYINSVNPSEVLITADNAGFAELIEPTFRQALARNAMPGVLAVTKVEFIPLDPDWWWMGTAALALERLHLVED